MNSFTGGRPQTFLLDLRGMRREPARHHAADIGPVPGVLQPAERLAAVVERQREAHVHQVRAAEIGIVDRIDVAGLGFAGLAFADQSDQLGGGILHGADEDRQPELALGDERAGRQDRRCRTSGRRLRRSPGEKAAREKVMSISLQTWPRPAWMTASVRISVTDRA